MTSTGTAGRGAARLERALSTRIPLRVRNVQVSSLRLPLVTRFRTAYGSIATKRALVVRLEDADGVTGWGEAPAAELPTFAPDTHDSSWYALTKLLAPLVVGKEFEGPAALAATWGRLKGYNPARHALECAAWAVASQRSGRPLSELWGGVRDAVPVGESFGIQDTLDDLLREIEARVAEGYCRIKVKIEPGWDVAVMRAVAAAFPGIPLSADGNCGYAAAEGGPWRELDELDLLMIEQPLPGDALAELADLQGSLRTPLCLDESATTPGLTRAALRLGAGRIVNIKPARIGGILASIQTHDECAAAAVPVWCGGMLETGIGRGFNLALASLPNFTLPADMSPAKLFYSEDLVDPTYDIRSDGTIAVPAGLGCGFPVQEDRIRRYAEDTWSSP